jgi:hypothetical protein
MMEAVNSSETSVSIHRATSNKTTIFTVVSKSQVVKLCVHDIPPLLPILSQINPLRIHPSCFINILSIGCYPPTYGKVLRAVSSIQAFRQKYCTLILPLPFMLHAPPISSFLILCPKYRVKSKIYEAHYFCCLLSFPSSQIQRFPSAAFPKRRA